MYHAHALAISYWRGFCRYSLKSEIIEARGEITWRRANITHWQMADGSRLVVKYIPGKKLKLCPLAQTETFYEELLR